MIKVRAEQQAIMLWNRSSGRTAILSGNELHVLSHWLSGQKETGFIRRLRELHLLPEKNREQVLRTIQHAAVKKSPLRSLAAPESLHIELTARCPLHCPQCYKDQGDQELSAGVLYEFIRQAEEAVVFQIALGGGEPLLYPELPDIIADINRRGMSATITTSGVGLTRKQLSQLLAAGNNTPVWNQLGSTDG